MKLTRMQRAWFAELSDSLEESRQGLLDQLFRPDPRLDALREPRQRRALAKLRASAAELDEGALDAVLDQCLRGLLHSVLVAIDNGSGLADTGLVSLVDDQGTSLGDGLHELFEIYVQERRAKAPRRRARVRDSRAPSSGHRRRRATP